MIRTTGTTTHAVFLTVATLALCVSGCNQGASVVTNRAGMGYYKMGHYSNAAHEFRQALVTDPNNADYAGNLAMALQKSGDVAGAEKMYQRALAADPTHQSTYREYSRLLANQNRTPEALALMQQYVGVQGFSAEPHVQLAELHRELGNRTGEIHALQQALKVNPEHPVALASMGEYFQDQGQTKTAMAMYERSLRSNYAQPDVQSRYATLQAGVQRDQQEKATLANLQQQQQRTAQAIQSMQHRTQSRLAAATPRPVTQIVQVPQQRVYAQMPVMQQAMQPSVQAAQIATLPQMYGSSSSIDSYVGTPSITQPVGPFFSDSQSVTSGEYAPGEYVTGQYEAEYEVGTTVTLPHGVSSGVALGGPEVAVPPTRISSGTSTTVNPQTTIPSRVHPHDHSHDHESHSPAADGFSQPRQPVSVPGTVEPDFDDSDLLGDVGVWDPVKSTGDSASASVDVGAF